MKTIEEIRTVVFLGTVVADYDNVQAIAAFILDETNRLADRCEALSVWEGAVYGRRPRRMTLESLESFCVVTP